MKKWAVETTKIYRYSDVYWLIPCICLKYETDYYIETDVSCPAIVLRISFINFAWGITIQKRY